jgi:hypothetical protein
MEDKGLAAGSGVDAGVGLVEELAPGGEGTGTGDERAIARQHCLHIATSCSMKDEARHGARWWTTT